jgi:hypothetical protein
MPSTEYQVKVIIDTEVKSVNSIKRTIYDLEKLKQAGVLSGKEMGVLMKKLENQSGSSYKAALAIKKLEERQRAFNKATKDAIAKNRKLTTTYLSIMFTGMALTRIFGGMIKSVFDIIGVTEMFSATVLVVLLPALMLVADVLFPIMEFFMNLPDGIKMVIGGFVLLGAAIGMLLTAIGMIGVYLISGLGQTWTVITGLWGVLTGFVGWVATALGVGFGVAFAIVVAIIIAVIALVVGAVEAWKNNFLGFKDAVIGVWEAIKTTVMGFVNFWTGVWNVISGIFTGNTDKMKEGFRLMAEGIKNIFTGVKDFIKNMMIALVGLVLSAVAQLIRPLEWAWNKIPGVKTTIYKDIMSAGSNVQIPSFQTGGVMPYTGMAMLHKGETIIPAGQNNSPTINIQANISNDYDVRRLADQLSKYWTNDFERVSKSRGII